MSKYYAPKITKKNLHIAQEFMKKQTKLAKWNKLSKEITAKIDMLTKRRSKIIALSRFLEKERDDIQEQLNDTNETWEHLNSDIDCLEFALKSIEEMIEELKEKK